MKLFFKILGGLVALLVIAIIALLLFFDPNVFKPRIESMAREQGVALTIDGNLGWQLWPSLGVEVNGIRVAAVTAPEDQIAELERASLLLALRPLFRGEVQVHHIVVEGARINARVDTDGTGNWEALLPDDDADDVAETLEELADEAEDGAELTLAVERITLRDSELAYSDARTGQAFALRDLNLEITGFNLQGDAFDLKAGWLAEITDPELFGGQTLGIRGDFSGRTQLAQDFDAADFRDGNLVLILSRANQSAQVRILLEAQASGLQDDLNFRATLDVPGFNPRQVMAVLDMPLETAETYALTQLALKVRAEGNLERVRIDLDDLTLDHTRLNGHVFIKDLETLALEAVIKGDAINVDHYLPPPSDDEDVAESDATGDEILIPLEVIKPLDMTLAFDMDQITVAALPLQNIRVRLAAKDGLVRLAQADLNLYEGIIASTASLDGRADTAIIRFDAGIKGLQLAPFMESLELADNIGLTGAINALAAGGTRGVTMNQLMAGMDAEASFSGAQVRVAPINVEQMLCQAINTVSRVETPELAWDSFTEMRQLAGKVVMKGPEIRVESFDAGVQQLALGVRGSLNLDTSAYDFTLPLRLLDSSTSEHGCRVTSNYWVDRSLSLLRCRGSLDELNPLSDCRPDARGLESLAKDFAEYQLRARYGDRIDETRQQLQEEREQVQQKIDEKKEEIQREAEQKLEQERRAIEDRLRDRLRR